MLDIKFIFLLCFPLMNLTLFFFCNRHFRLNIPQILQESDNVVIEPQFALSVVL